MEATKEVLEAEEDSEVNDGEEVKVVGETGFTEQRAVLGEKVTLGEKVRSHKLNVLPTNKVCKRFWISCQFQDLLKNKPGTG